LTYLKVDPATAARRLHRSAHLRPLLLPGPAEALEALLEARQGAYEQADWVVDTEVLTRGASVTKLDRAEPSAQSSDIRYVWEGSDRVLPL
jgi:shikimate kinase